jgi:hypothetical protein
MASFRSIHEDVVALQEYFPNLTDYEALDIVMRNIQLDAFKSAFVVLDSDSVPSALESIAISLGQNPVR